MLTETTQDKMQTKIMRRVRLVWWWRRMTSPTALKLEGLISALGVEAILTSLPNIFINLSRAGNPLNVSQYLLTAFTHTEFMVQLVLSAGLILLALTFLDLLKTLRTYSLFSFSRTV